MQAYRDYNVEYDPVLNNIEETPWAYMDVKGTRSAIQITQGRWALEHGVAGWQTLMLAGTAGLALAMGSGSGSAGSNESPAPTYTVAEFEGRRVYQRDINWNLIDENGLSNVQRVQKGRAPIGNDGREIVLHHVIQEEPGPMAEVLATVHQRGHKLLHGLAQAGESFRNNPVLLRQYKNFQQRYWRWRGRQLGDE